jgi:hypothetical protein
MAEYILGYEQNQIIRKACGSPGIWFIFDDRSHSIVLDNSISGALPIYFNFNEVASTGSTSGFLDGGKILSADVRIGSVNILGSGAATHSVQVIRLT